MPEPAEGPSNEAWRDLQARVSAFGSAEVGDASEEFFSKTRAFYAAVSTYRAIRDRPTGDFREAAEQMTTARTKAQTAYDNVRNLVRDELANL